jgi:hypothetical protein
MESQQWQLHGTSIGLCDNFERLLQTLQHNAKKVLKINKGTASRATKQHCKIRQSRKMVVRSPCLQLVKLAQLTAV